jgi:hypothetical protein
MKTIIEARDCNGKLTFRSVAQGVWDNSRINKELRRWMVNPKRETIEVKYI